MKQFCSSTIIDEKIGDILSLKVKFKNDKTGRLNSGIISDITAGACQVIDKRHVSRWVSWNDVYDIR